MTAPAAITGMLVDARNVASHKSFRLVIDIPAEEAMKAIDAFGWPTGVNPVPVAVARLNLKAAKEAPTKSNTPTNSENATPAGGSKRSWSELPPAQQAGIRCGEEAFLRFLKRDNPDAAANRVRDLCLVESRADLNTNPKAATRWRDLEAEYQAWLSAPVPELTT